MEHDSFLKKITEKVSSLQPLIEITGRNRILLEHHKGICCYREQEIIINMPYGSLRIRGSKLSLSIATSEQLLITGIIEELTLLGDEVGD